MLVLVALMGAAWPWSSATGEVGLYERLGLTKTAKSKELRKAWHAAALKNHPDKVEGVDKEAAAQRFKAIAEAYEVLSEPALRRQYDQTGQVPSSDAQAKAASQRAAAADKSEPEFDFEGASRQPPPRQYRHLSSQSFEVRMAQQRARRVTSLLGCFISPGVFDLSWGV